MQKLMYTIVCLLLSVWAMGMGGEPPANDECFDAIPIECGDVIEGFTSGANFDEVAICENGEGENPGAPGVWYSFIGTGEEVTISLCGSNYDTQLAIYSGNCDGLLECEEANDDSQCGLQSEITFVTELGVEYYVLVNGFSGSIGDFILSYICGCNENAPISYPWAEKEIGNSNGDAFYDDCEETICVESYGFPLPNADLTHFVYTCMCGDGVFTVKVESVTPAAKGGIMFRETCEPGSKKAALKTQFTYSTLLFRDVRVSTDAYQQSQQIPIPGHVWLRLVRQGNYILGYASQNGGPFYFTFFKYIPMSHCIDVGMFVESPNVNTYSQACFSNISLDGRCRDIELQAEDADFDIGQQLFEPTREINVYPNPTSDEFNIGLDQFLGKSATIRITNSLGQLMETRKLGIIEHPSERFDVSNWNEGVYIVSVITDNGQEIGSKRIVVGGSRP